MSMPPLAALEIGTSRIVALVGEVREDGVLLVTGLGDVKSIGVRKSEIMDFSRAQEAVRSALKMAENQAETDIVQVNLVISGAHVRSDVQSGMVNILNEDQEITKQEVEGVKEVARKLNLAPDREVLHSIDQLFRVDDRAGVFNPAGQLGKKLVLDVLLIHAMNSAVENTVKVVRDMPLDVKDVAYAGLCSALAVLTPEQKKSGVALLDLGAGTTHVLAYANETLALAQTLDVGGDHITNDIALGLNLPHQQAERLKIESGSALLDARSRSGTLSLAPEGGFSGRKIQEKDLQVIVNARMDETLEMVHDLLKEKGLLSRMGAGLVLTGRGARLKDLVTLSERMFNLPCSIGTPRDIGGMRQIAEGPDYASVVGMLRYAARSAQERPAGWFQSLLKWGRT